MWAQTCVYTRCWIIPYSNPNNLDLGAIEISLDVNCVKEKYKVVFDRAYFFAEQVVAKQHSKNVNNSLAWARWTWLYTWNTGWGSIFAITSVVITG